MTGEVLKFVGIFITILGITASATGYVSHRTNIPFREFPIGSVVYQPTARSAIRIGLIGIGVGIGLLALFALLF